MVTDHKPNLSLVCGTSRLNPRLLFALKFAWRMVRRVVIHIGNAYGLSRLEDYEDDVAEVVEDKKNMEEIQDAVLTPDSVGDGSNPRKRDVGSRPLPLLLALSVHAQVG